MNSTESPLENFLFPDQAKSELWINPSTPSSICTKTPKGLTSTTVPETIVPTEYFPAASAQGFELSCFIPNFNFLSPLFNSVIITLTSSPTFTKVFTLTFILIQEKS